MLSSTPPGNGTCVCSRPHYPLRFFRRGGLTLATRGFEPVAYLLDEGWEEVDPGEATRNALVFQYNLSHRFDWLHTPTYLDDKETHLRMKAQTARRMG